MFQDPIPAAHAPGPWFEAERGGECSLDGCEIEPGDEIRADGRDGWERRECVEESEGA